MNNKFWIIIASLLILLGCATMEDNWNKAQRENTWLSYDKFQKNYPESPYAKEAIAQRDKKLWDFVQKQDTPRYYEIYLKELPNGSHINEAKQSIDLKQAQKTDTISSYESFITKYPDSIFAKEVRSRIEELKKEAVFESEFYAKLNTVDNQAEIEKLIDSYSKYTFMKNVIPKVEDMIITKIRIDGSGHNRFVVKADITEGGRIRNTFWAVKTKNDKTKASFLVGQDFPSDDQGLNALMFAPNWGDNSILRFSNEGIGIEISKGGYVYHGKGDRLHRLTFVLLKNIGWVYVRGKGQVVSPKGEISNFDGTASNL